MKVWFPTVKTRSGSDVFVQRIAAGLGKIKVNSEITWYSHWQEFVPFTLMNKSSNSVPDVIHVNSWHGFPFARQTTPLVVTCHHCVHDDAFKVFSNVLQKCYHRTLIKNYERRALQKAAKVTTVSEYTAAVVRKQFPFVEPVVIPNGIETDYFTPQRSNFNKTNKFRILYVGNASKRKGFDLLPEIMRKLGANYRLYYTSGLRNKKIQLPDNCESLEYLTKEGLLQAYRECDAVICPSRYEGFGYVVCEGMACGKPVVVSNSSALPELIQHGINGLLCENNNADDFVEAIKTLAEDKQLQNDLGIAARAVVEERYSLDSMVLKYLELYSALI